MKCHVMLLPCAQIHLLKTLPSTCINKFQKVIKAITLTYDIGTTIEEEIETEFETPNVLP